MLKSGRSHECEVVLLKGPNSGQHPFLVVSHHCPPSNKHGPQVVLDVGPSLPKTVERFLRAVGRAGNGTVGRVNVAAEMLRQQFVAGGRQEEETAGDHLQERSQGDLQVDRRNGTSR